MGRGSVLCLFGSITLTESQRWLHVADAGDFSNSCVRLSQLDPILQIKVNKLKICLCFNFKVQ